MNRFKLDSDEMQIIDTSNNAHYDIKEACELLNKQDEQIIKQNKEHHRLIGILQEQDEYIKNMRFKTR